MKTITLLVMSSMIIAGGAAHSQDVLNGSFEEGDDRHRPKHWYNNGGSTSKSTLKLAWDDRAAHSGRFSISINLSKDYPQDQEEITYNWVTDVKELVPGESYELTAWIKTHEIRVTPTVLVQFKDTNDKLLQQAGTHHDYDVQGTTDWTQVNCVFVVPLTTTQVRLRACLRATQNAGGTAWFDDIAIAKAGQGPKR